MDQKRKDFSEQTIFFDTPTDELSKKGSSKKQRSDRPLKNKSSETVPNVFSPGEDGSYTVVSKPERKATSPWSITWKISTALWKLALGVVLVFAIAAFGLVGFLTVTEYNPAYAENAKRGSVNRSESISNRSLKLVTYNTGHAVSDREADHYTEGGTGVKPLEQETVDANMEGIQGFLSGRAVDFVFLQEVDVDSDRSFGINQWLTYENVLESYESRFALNHSCNYVPSPMSDPLGKVESGIATYSVYDITSATRYSLSSSYTWPTRVVNPKSCLLVTRIPIDGSEQELVLVNVHLEAYEDEDAREAQNKQLLTLVKEEYAKGNYVIAGGDFNQSFPGSTAYSVEDDTLWTPKKLSYAPAGWVYAYDDKKPTGRLMNQPYDAFDSDSRFYVIDGFLVSPNITVDKVTTLDYHFRYSNHNPVMLEFTLETDVTE